MTGHGCRPTCPVCEREAARARDDARADLLPRLAPYFSTPEEGNREPAAA